MNKDFQLANKAYEVETAILKLDKNILEQYQLETESNITITNKDEAIKLGVQFPEGLELLGANYNKTTGTTVILCQDTNTGEILASCAGTNFYPGETSKDVNNWFDIMSYGISPYGEEVNSIINFFNQMGMYPSRISGHSLGGYSCNLIE